MKYYIAIVIRHGYNFYLSKIKPGTNVISQGPEWYAYMGPQQAFRFTTKEGVLDAIASYSEGKDMKLGGIAEVNLYPLIGAKNA